MDHEEEGSRIDLRVRVALLEQSEVHRDQLAGMHRDMMEARSAAIERQVATIADQQAMAWERLRQHGETLQASRLAMDGHGASISQLSTRQDKHDQLAVRLRYAAAAGLVFLAGAGHVAPETLGKLARAFVGLP